MRKIKTTVDSEKSKKRNRVIISLIFLAIMVMSTAGYAAIYGFGNGNSSAPISNQANVVEVQGNNITLQNDLEQVQNVSLQSFKNINSYSGQVVYLDSNSSQGVYIELYQTIGMYASRFQEACYGNCSLNLPQKNCSDNLIIWRDSPENKVYEQDNCVFIDGDLRAVDAFIYRLFGKL